MRMEVNPLFLQSDGVGTKADQALKRTQGLHEEAGRNRDDLATNIEPEISRAFVNVDDVTRKNKVTKQMVESTSRFVEVS